MESMHVIVRIPHSSPENVAGMLDFWNVGRVDTENPSVTATRETTMMANAALAAMSASRFDPGV